MNVTLPPGSTSARTSPGSPGTVAAAFGVTGLDASEAADQPSALCASTSKVYSCPLTSPSMLHDVLTDSQVRAPGLERTRYPSIAAPLSEGATHDTSTRPSPARAIGLPGASGTLGGSGITTDTTVHGPGPLAFRALTRISCSPAANARRTDVPSVGSASLHDPFGAGLLETW